MQRVISILRKTFIFAGLFAAIYAVFEVFLPAGLPVFTDGKQGPLVVLLFVLVTVFVFFVLEAFFQKSNAPYVPFKRDPRQQVIKIFMNEARGNFGPAGLSKLAVDCVNGVLALENVTVMLHDAAKEGFRVAATSSVKKKEQLLSDSEELVTLLKDSGYILRREQKNNTVKKKMRELGTDAAFLMKHRDDIIGILFSRGSRPNGSFLQDDVDVLLLIAGVLSSRIANARFIEELSVIQAQLAQKEKMAAIGMLTTGINHDICNPLGIVRGQCEMFLLNLAEGIYKDVSEKELVEKAKTVMEKVISETDRATTITRRLASFSRPAKDKKTDDVHIDREIEEVCSIVKHELEMDNISIKKEIGKDIPGIVADPKQIQEIFFSLIRNAAQVILENGEISICVKGEGERVSVEIEDSGPGVDGDRLHRVFTPYFAGRSCGRCPGLGLFIVRRIVERNNGSIDVRAGQKNGTLFRLVFETKGKQAKLGAGQQ